MFNGWNLMADMNCLGIVSKKAFLPFVHTEYTLLISVIIYCWDVLNAIMAYRQKDLKKSNLPKK